MHRGTQAVVMVDTGGDGEAGVGSWGVSSCETGIGLALSQCCCSRRY